MRRIGTLIAISVLAISMFACNYRAYFERSSGHDYGSRNKSDAEIRSYGAYSSNPKQHDNRYFEYSSAISRQISALPGIASAIVFLTDRNAYVGIMTDWTATGTHSSGSVGHEQQNGGTMDGFYNVDTYDAPSSVPGSLAGQMATNHNSYFTLKDVSDLSSKLKQTIGNEVRRAHPRVDEVHISANREFVNQLAEYSKAARTGSPLAPITPDFNRLVKYVFGMGKEIPLSLSDLYGTGANGTDGR